MPSRKPDLPKVIERALAALHKQSYIDSSTAHGQVDIFFTKNSILRQLKKEWLHKDMAVVDVLSFPENQDFPDPERKHLHLGEIHINSTIARTRPRRSVFLALHGLLHLLGYRHESKRDTIEMEKMEHVLLEALGDNIY